MYFESETEHVVVRFDVYIYIYIYDIHIGSNSPGVGVLIYPLVC